LELVVIGPLGAGPHRLSDAPSHQIPPRHQIPLRHQIPMLLKVTMMSFKTAVARGCSTSK
jgi:hypothetical protein